MIERFLCHLVEKCFKYTLTPRFFPDIDTLNPPNLAISPVGPFISHQNLANNFLIVDCDPVNPFVDVFDDRLDTWSKC